MKKKLLAMLLAVVLACALLVSPALAAPSAAMMRQIRCSVLDNGVEVTFYGNVLSGQGVVQLATYSVQGRLLDFKSVLVEDLAQGYNAVIPARTEPGGGFKVFLTGGESYQPLVENAKGHLPKDPAADPDCLLTVTKGAAFWTDGVKLWNERYTDDYIGVDQEVQVDERPNVFYYVNGERCDHAQDARPGDVAKLYDRDHNGRVDEVRITMYQVAKLTGDPIVQPSESGDGTVVMVPGVTGGFIPVDQVTGDYAGLKKDDVVLFYTSPRPYGIATSDETVTLETPETVTGKVTRVSSRGQLYVNGIWYGPTGINAQYNGDRMIAWNDFENTYTFYLDKNGGICYADQYVDPTLADQVAVVLESRWISGGGIDANNYMQAKLLLANGDVVITPIDKVGVEVNGSIVMCVPSYKMEDTSLSNKRVPYWTITGDYAGSLNGSLTPANGFWSYRVNADGHYELVNLELKSDQYAAATVASVSSTTAVVNKPLFSEGLYANNDTLFMVEKYDNSNDTSVYSAFTGYNNVPPVNAGAVCAITAISARDERGDVITAARYVYIKAVGDDRDLPVEPPTEFADGNVAVVLESCWISGGGIDASNYMQAKLLLENGDVVITPIDKVGVEVNGSIVMCVPSYKMEDTSLDNQRVPYWTITGGDLGNLGSTLTPAHGFWNYGVNASGHYELVNLELKSDRYAAATSPTVTTSTKVEAKPAFTDGLLADSDTVFMVERFDPDKDISVFDAFTGYANVPAVKAGDVVDITAICEEGAAAVQYVYIKACDVIEPPAEPPTEFVDGNVAVVLESRWINGGGIDANNYMQAKLLLENGDVVITPIDKVGVEVNGSIVMCVPSNKMENTSLDNKRVPYWTITGGGLGNLDSTLTPANGFWNYGVNASGHYELVNLELKSDQYAAAGSVEVTDATQVEPKPAFTDGLLADGNTLFLVEKYDANTDTSTFETVTGFKNVPAMGPWMVREIVAISGKGETAAKYVYIRTNGYQSDLPEGLFFVTDDEYARNADYYIINVLEPQTGARTTMAAEDRIPAGGDRKMYVVDAMRDGVAVSMTAVDCLTNAEKADKGLIAGILKSIGAGVVTFANSDGSNRTFQYDDDTICVLIDLAPNRSAGKYVYSSSGIFDPHGGVDMEENIYQSGAELYVIADKDDVARYIYVVRTRRA